MSVSAGGGPAALPGSAAIAAAAVTAQIQAQEAISSNLGMDPNSIPNLAAPSLPFPALPVPIDHSTLATAPIIPDLAPVIGQPVGGPLQARNLQMAAGYGGLMTHARKCGLPRDAEGRPIKAMSQIQGGMPQGMARFAGPPRMRSRSRSPIRRSRGRSRSRSRGRRSRSPLRRRSPERPRESRSRRSRSRDAVKTPRELRRDTE